MFSCILRDSGDLAFPEPRHVAFADDAAMPIEAVMATADTERFPMIGNRSIKLGTTMTAVMAQF